MKLLALAAIALSAVGLVALSVQLLVVVWHRRRRRVGGPTELRPVSILKPLCGRDDDLDENLRAFGELDHPSYEVLLGLKDANDEALASALRAVKRQPDRFRLVFQIGEPGYNPKVNQLTTLEREARFDILVVSDSNVRVERDYLLTVNSALSDPGVGCVTHPITGSGERRWGSLLDNLHLSAAIGPGMIGAKLAGGQDIVVGKSMALRRADLEALGGFRAFKNVLAEDYVIGRQISSKLGKRVVVSTSAVVNVSRDKSIFDFARRYFRWSVIHRTALRPTTYAAQIVLNPIPVALCGVILNPARENVFAAVAAVFAKTLIDLSTASALGRRPDLRSALGVVVKDLVLFVAWLRGFQCRTVNWRGNKLRVLEGSRLEPVVPRGVSARAT